MKALIVEDDFTSRLLLQELLKNDDSAHIAVNVNEALDAVHLALELGEPYGLICLDIMMTDHRTIDDTSSTSSSQELHNLNGKFEARQPQKMKKEDRPAYETVYDINNMTGIFFSAEMANPFHF